MSGYGTTSASYGLTDKIQTLLAPGWQAQPELKAREDGLDEVTIAVPRRHARESWHLSLTQGGTVLVAYHTDGMDINCSEFPRTNHHMVVLVPPGRLETFQVLTKRPTAPTR